MRLVIGCDGGWMFEFEFKAVMDFDLGVETQKIENCLLQGD
jgi:hypothetical protein